MTLQEEYLRGFIIVEAAEASPQEDVVTGNESSVGVGLVGVHGGGVIDDVGNAAARVDYLAERGVFDLASDIEVELLPVSANSGLHGVVEVVSEV